MAGPGIERGTSGSLVRCTTDWAARPDKQISCFWGKIPNYFERVLYYFQKLGYSYLLIDRKPYTCGHKCVQTLMGFISFDLKHYTINLTSSPLTDGRYKLKHNMVYISLQITEMSNSNTPQMSIKNINQTENGNSACQNDTIS